MYRVHALVLFTLFSKNMSEKEWFYMTDLFTDVSQITAFIGVMAFIVSIIVEALKKWTWLDSKVPTALMVIVLSMILCPVSMLGMAAYYGMVIEWYTVFASFIAAFIVALVSMDGWERITDLAERFIRKK